ncbi:MAG: chain-length determining protein [Prevotella sp.]|nr:chain-length determining protein [Prevotella sp.]
MEEQQYIEQEESSIDFGQIFAAIKKRKRLYYKVLPIVFVLACVYVLGLPNYYNCEVKLSPELSTKRSTSSLSALASQFGMNLGTGATGSEALFPTLYPDLMNSTDFKASLFNIPVHKKDSTRMMSYYDYMAKEQKKSWWGAAISAPFKLLGSMFGKKDTIDQHKVDPFMLTKEQTKIVQAIDKKVVCDVDKKTMVITINVTDQDPLIAATMADSVQQRLQNFITDYRTKKAKIDLEYNRKLFKEAKARYDKARQLYASFSDANQDIILESVRTKLTDLENEMQLQFNNYNSIAQQLQLAEAKVQEETPAFTTLQSATVPVKKAGPARSKMVLIFLFLAFLGTTVYILHKENQLKPLLGL